MLKGKETLVSTLVELTNEEYAEIMKIVETHRQNADIAMNADIIRRETGCTDEQAKYLAEEIEKLPKVKAIIMSRINEVNLFDCETVEIIRLYGYMDHSVKIAGNRLDKENSFTCCGKEFKSYKKHLWTFDSLFPDKRCYEIF